jgi:DNA integrity scanning protein DisA with diadenylate cyclase activity
VSLSDNKLILAELENSGVAPFLPEFCKTKVALAEIQRLLSPIRHEGHTVPYGFIFAKTKGCVEQLTASRRLIQQKNLTSEVARRLADGLHAFVTYVRADRFLGLLCFDPPLADEAQLVAAALDLRGMVGRVDTRAWASLYLGAGIAACENRQWLFKPHVQSILEAVTQCVPQADTVTLRKLLEFCYYKLSPLRIGATIVWCLREPTQGEIQKMKPQIDLQPYNLNPSAGNDAAVITHLLSNADGALILDHTTTAIGAAAHLQYSKKSERLIRATEGIRHTSARRFSYDLAKAVVFVVSSDGPVSVFSDGVKVGHLAVVPAADVAAGLKKMVPLKKQDVSYTSYRIVCAHCGKTSVVEEVVVIGWKEMEETYCKLCGTQLYASMCFQLGSHILKVL